MKTLAFVVAVLALSALLGCEKGTYGVGGPTEPSRESSSISGELSLDPAVQGSIVHTMVAVYTSEADFRAGQPSMVAWTDEQGRYSIEGLCCGQYWIDALKDNDGDAVASPGDFYFVHKDCNGCPCPFTVDQRACTFNCRLEVVR